ncbi:unnamed protein product, partial [Meganyctiphanes norvegica]
AVCHPVCLNGQCTSPNSCSCFPGWRGNHCDIPVCHPVCLNGQCTSPNSCTCFPGWRGNHCDIPVCVSGCLHGTCTKPNRCTCHNGWINDQCGVGPCNKALNGTSGVITSPNYPRKFPFKLKGIWHITVNCGKRIMLSFIIRKTKRCRADYLEIQDADSNIEKVRLCNTSYKYYSSTNKIFVTLINNHDNSRKGFKIKWKTINST